MNTTNTTTTPAAKTYPCRTCAAPIEATTGKRGRPRQFCDDECRQVENVAVWMDTLIGGESMLAKWSATPEGMEKALAMRGRLWSSANLLNAAAKGYRKAAKETK
ncbi:hypothetical protein CMI37_04660 [Candidatus Pacearchaeota archaeon]|nr:hypothetical protein [Candidatus Pacearchaeota archaeon]